jgi:hypothetical protein
MADEPNAVRVLRIMEYRPSDECPARLKLQGCEDPDCSRIECLHLGTCWEDAFRSEDSQ